MFPHNFQFFQLFIQLWGAKNDECAMALVEIPCHGQDGDIGDLRRDSSDNFMGGYPPAIQHGNGKSCITGHLNGQHINVDFSSALITTDQL